MKHRYISRLSRREFLQFSGIGMGAALLAACAPRATPEPAATAVPPTEAPQPEAEEPHALVGDVMDFALTGDWPGSFGFVKFKLHAGFFNGDKLYFIRTDASDQAYAQENGLVFVPLLLALQNIEGVAGSVYFFDDAPAEQLPIFNTSPAEENYSPVCQIYRVTSQVTQVFDSAESLREAETAGEVTVEAQPIYVNMPVVKWPGGEMSVDQEKEKYLGGGQLLEPVDSEGMTVTFKLHECYPGSRYIVTDTSAAPMAPMMAVSASAPIQKILEQEAGGTDKIWVFANGIQGSGVMGFQPAIFAHRAGEALWSPLWNHFTLGWVDGHTPRVLKSEADIMAALEAGDVEQFNGTPDTHPNGFIVNCPVPVLAPNTFAG